MVAIRACMVIALGALTLVSCGHEVFGEPGPAPSTLTGAPISMPETTTVPSTTSAQAPIAVDPNAFRGQQPGSFYFVTASSKFECAILAQVEAVAGCHGELPPSAPQVPGSASPGTLVTPNAIEVSGDTAGKFYSAGDPQFHRFEGAARVLPYDRVLVAGGFTCSVDEYSGVTCESKAGHGFTVSDADYDAW
jgi:hypothetical protein